MRSLKELDDQLYSLNEDFLSDIRRLDGDLLVLGAGGKMGPSLSMLAVKAIREAGLKKTVYAVSRFQNAEARNELEQAGVKVIPADLMDDSSLRKLPAVPNIIYMAGTKFGTTGNEALTWAMNAYLPGRVAEQCRQSKIVVFSTGNVYPLTEVISGGPSESNPVGPIGEYAQSCLGRERVFHHFSQQHGTPMLMFRLNYAIDLRYGVLLEIAKSVKNGVPIKLSMGHVNVIWQGDANQIAIRCLHHCSSPPEILNVTGSSILALRDAAQAFGKIFNKEPVFEGVEQSTALLSNASKMERLFPFAKVSVSQMIEMTAEWLLQDGAQLNKPTHFQERSGKF